jgi:hypothetical protein
MKKVNNEEFHNLFSSPHIIKAIESRTMRWAGYIACIGQCYKHVTFQLEKKPLGSPRHKWENNIKYNLKETEYEGADWKQMAEIKVHGWAVVNAAMNIRISRRRKFLGKASEYNFPRRTLLHV